MPFPTSFNTRAFRCLSVRGRRLWPHFLMPANLSSLTPRLRTSVFPALPERGDFKICLFGITSSEGSSASPARGLLCLPTAPHAVFLPCAGSTRGTVASRVSDHLHPRLASFCGHSGGHVLENTWGADILTLQWLVGGVWECQAMMLPPWESSALQHSGGMPPGQECPLVPGALSQAARWALLWLWRQHPASTWAALSFPPFAPRCSVSGVLPQEPRLHVPRSGLSCCRSHSGQLVCPNGGFLWALLTCRAGQRPP